MGKLAESLNRLPAGSRLYRLQTRPQLLAQSGQADRLFELLTDFDFVEAKVYHPDIDLQELIEDYDRGFEPKVLICGEKAETLRLIQGALRLSAQILTQDKTQLAAQLWGRLMSFEVPEIQAMLKQVKQCQYAPWLRPLTSNLMPPGGHLLQTIIGHTGAINTVAVSLDSKQIISSSIDNTLKVWDLHTGKELFTVFAHTRPVQAAAVLLDGNRVISRSGKNTLKVWNLETREELLTLTGHHALRVGAVTPDGNQVIFVLADNTLKVWNWERPEKLFTLTGHTHPVNAVAVTLDGKRVISGSSDKTLKVWNLETAEELFTLKGHARSVNAVAVTLDGKRVISASYDNTLKVWDLENRRIIASFTGESALTCCAVAPDGVTIVAGEASGRVHFLRLEGVAQCG